MRSHTVTNITTEAVLQKSEEFGIGKDYLLSKSGLDKEFVGKSESRMAIEDISNLWENSARETRQRMIGLYVGSSVSFGTYGVIDYLMATSSTPRKSLLRSSQFYPLVNGSYEYSLIEKGGRAFIELQNPVDEKNLQTHYIDGIFSSILNLIRRSTFSGWSPKEVQLTCSEPREYKVYSEFFRAPVKFGQTANRMILDPDLLKIPQVNADPFLCEVLGFYAKSQLKRIDQEKDLIYEIRKALYEGIEHGDTDLDSVAVKMAQSRRNIQRKLRDSGVSFREILDGVRSEIARDLLKSKNSSIEEIAYLLGYAEQSSFFRAFKRWTGKTPQQFSGE
ncbi:MAG: AraC family transcriptional regulator [Pyrinomonadaceae bacterium]